MQVQEFERFGKSKIKRFEGGQSTSNLLIGLPHSLRVQIATAIGPHPVVREDYFGKL
jgi:hypothetical protein